MEHRTATLVGVRVLELGSGRDQRAVLYQLGIASPSDQIDHAQTPQGATSP